jgi:hypothetical protein
MCGTNGTEEKCVHGFGPKIGRVKTIRRWEYNIEVDVKETEHKCMDWIHLAQDINQWRALVNKVMNLRVP